MPDAAWKQFERRMAALFGGERRGAHTSDSGHGRSDVILAGWSIECKLLSRPAFQDLLDAARQAERNAEKATDIPLAVVKRKGDHDENALAVMRLETFMEWFGKACLGFRR